MTKRKPRLAALLAATALFAGSIGTVGVLALTGSLGTTKVVESTTVPSSARNAPVSTSSSTTLDAQSLYKSASAGVVDITAKGTSTTQSRGPFGAPQSSQSTATGSGFVIDTQGHIVTAAHVVEGASSITVKFQDGTTRTATVVGKDDATDIAVLKVDASALTLHPLSLASSSNLQIGDAVAAIGDPFGYARSFSTGIVSGLDRTIDAPNGFTVAHAIQTDAALNPGNSGGPLLDASGHVIGIVDQIATDGSADQSSGVGFAVPIDLVKSEIQTLEAGRNVQHAYLGVSTSDTSDGATGALVQQVVAGGPASDGGLQAGDVITQIDGQKVDGSSSLVATVAEHRPGEKLTLTVERSGETVHVTVTLGVQPAGGPASAG
ncbi:MAG TPA: trypsin-like peptidase domain-containing protein [Thermoleophilaceae bacterium]|jgi:putative serine protease PepD|nr:trypsin-like peptidase domain-containing protein [Thermoleophilaceae bacterium]